MRIYITAILKANLLYRDEVRATLQHMVQESRKEAACMQYDLHQTTDDENQFIFYEIWESRAGLEHHNQQPYILAFGRMAEEKLQETPQIYLMERIA
ncbi:putative quinol monooxygenase [Sphingobacterium athyrii]|uniref:Antibiotic biosynthesis monooxygenase n=1 Tax=Sphingobacterium athyrii TaxID=2152717 RepID=A0A363P0C6_9SPHI|nr:putative quinol monooxygenase [Sphingobacterium athyrii]PUV26535.1 antibiotic biosynthesis monooxygenase [Sphingobacterium athyrii]